MRHKCLIYLLAVLAALLATEVRLTPGYQWGNPGPPLPTFTLRVR
jgi:hypothetical protein